MLGCASIVFIRFFLAASLQPGPDGLSSAFLGVGSFAVALSMPRTSVFAVLILMPWVNGLDQAALLGCPAAISVIFACMFLGWMLSDVVKWFGRLRTMQSSTLPGVPSAMGIAAFVAEIMAGVIVLCLVLQLKRYASPDLFNRAIHQAVFGFGDRYYFLTAAFIWIQGLLLFSRLCSEGIEIWHWIEPILCTWACVSIALFLFQYFTNIPEGWTTGSFLPFEDISSFGSISVMLFLFMLTTFRSKPRFGILLGAILVLGTAAMLIASWSRGAWLTALVFGLVVLGKRLPKKVFALVLGTIVIAVAVINANAQRESWIERPYIARLITLVKIENPANKSAGRTELYYKAFGMLRERPLTGHGIGSFYLKSVNYARQGDPLANVPDFAHNTFLQLAAEIGIPVTLLFIVLTAWILCRGFSGGAGRSFDGAHSLLVIGTTIALAGYLMTQMTANSLNVYVSNQVVFWFLAAALLALTTCPNVRVRSMIPKGNDTILES